MSTEFPVFEGYTVVDRLAEDPITHHFRATHASLGRKVVIKALNPNLLPSSPFAQQLEREALILATLHHPNIASVYDFKKAPASTWLAREWVDGFSLLEVLRKSGSLSAAFATGIAVQLASALAHAHSNGVVHRALAPSCIWLARSGDVKLLGFAHALGGRLPTAPELMGGESGFAAPSYLSPEQILGESITLHSDLFSLGAVLYEMLTGTRPAATTSPSSPTGRNHTATLPTLLRHDSSVPLSLEHAALRCLEKLPRDRYASALELEEALSSTLAELGAGSAQTAVQAGLRQCALIPRSASASTPEHGAQRSTPRLRSGQIVKQATIGFALCLMLVVVGGGMIQLVSRARSGAARSSAASMTTTIPKPTERALVRVVVDPWAHVYVNGQYFDVTPFAEPVMLASGTHLFRFEHPKAKTEQRQVSVEAGETVLLDVRMNIPRLHSPPTQPSAAPAMLDSGP